ncbi:MAG: hypothetical protein FWF49_04265 [Oscillospiraceae bacterium]|nr:hypothetical protein [Oscillospiraceae bacterium]
MKKTIPFLLGIFLLTAFLSACRGAPVADVSGQDGTIQGNLYILSESGERLLDKSDIASATCQYDGQSGAYTIVLTANAQGTAKIAAFTKDLVGQQTYIYIDDELLSSPHIMAQMTTPYLMISGTFSSSEAEATALCDRINIIMD